MKIEVEYKNGDKGYVNYKQNKFLENKFIQISIISISLITIGVFYAIVLPITLAASYIGDKFK